VLDVDVTTGDIDVVKQTPTPNVDLDSYVAERMWATAPDGKQVPIDVVRHVDTPVDGSAPCCVYGYGSYEASMPPWFSVARLSWLDRGGVWALVHPRGGGELGRGWYLDGKLLAKRNTFTDTLAACAHLVTMGVASADRVAIRGGSAHVRRRRLGVGDAAVAERRVHGGLRALPRPGLVGRTAGDVHHGAGHRRGETAHDVAAHPAGVGGSRARARVRGDAHERAPAEVAVGRARTAVGARARALVSPGGGRVRGVRMVES